MCQSSVLLTLLARFAAFTRLLVMLKAQSRVKNEIGFDFFRFHRPKSKGQNESVCQRVRTIGFRFHRPKSKGQNESVCQRVRTIGFFFKNLASYRLEIDKFNI